MTWSILKLWFKLLDGIKNEIKAINCGKQNNYGKDSMKIKLSVWVIKMLQYKKIDVSEGIDTNKTSASKRNICFVIIGILKMLRLNLNHMFVINVVMFWWLLMYQKNIAMLNVKRVEVK